MSGNLIEPGLDSLLAGWDAPVSLELEPLPPEAWELLPLALEALTDGHTVEALRPGPSLRRGNDTRWEMATEVGL